MPVTTDEIKAMDILATGAASPDLLEKTKFKLIKFLGRFDG